MALIILIACGSIAAFELFDRRFRDGADKAQRRMTECIIAVMAAMTCAVITW